MLQLSLRFSDSELISSIDFFMNMYVNSSRIILSNMLLCIPCSVSKLQEAICSSYNIPPDKQVMLISGGENLDPAARVCSYSAGTVSSNRVFVYSVTGVNLIATEI